VSIVAATDGSLEPTLSSVFRITRPDGTGATLQVPLGGRLDLLGVLGSAGPNAPLSPAGPGDAPRARELIAGLRQGLASLDPADEGVRRAQAVLDLASAKADDLDLLARYPELATAARVHFRRFARFDAGGAATVPAMRQDLLAARASIASRPGVPEGDRAGILADIQAVLDELS
jgi:hypothetical protein